MTANELIEHIELEYIEENIYRGDSRSIGTSRVFGGQVLAQALHAATRTVPKDRLVHSLHSYFILPGDVSKPIIYIVARTRDGGSFTTRRVRAVQNGQDIFVLACSFQLAQEGLDHQMKMPEVPGPENLPTDVEMVKTFAELIPEKFRRFTEDKPLVFKPVEIPDFLTPIENEPFQHVWLKAKGELPDDQAVQRTVLAYASDYNLLYTALRPHAVVLGDMQLASLDHAMWFHRDFHLNDWLLYALDSPSASNARGFTRGKVFDRQGRLVASVAQEGMIRKRRKKK